MEYTGDMDESLKRFMPNQMDNSIHIYAYER